MADSQTQIDPASSRRPPRLSVVLSFWNESDIIPELVRRLRLVLGQEREKGTLAGHELIFVNDASTDRSEAILKELAVGHDDIRIVNMSRNFGVSPCVLAGMDFATGDAVVYMDADLQDPPEVIPEMLRAWQSEPDVEIVHTVRTARAGETWFKMFLTRIGYKILKASSMIDLPIQAGDFKLISRRALDQLRRLREKRPFVRGLVCWIGFKQKTVHYERDARFSGPTKHPVLGYKVISNFLDSAIISFSDVPLKFSIVCGMVSLLSALVYMVVLLVQMALGMDIAGWTAIMVAVLFLGGVQLLSIGILGSYVGSIFLETKGRPNYIVKDTFGFGEGASVHAESDGSNRAAHPSAPAEVRELSR
jgi:dolichol-phosphate mannosyltransferase